MKIFKILRTHSGMGLTILVALIAILGLVLMGSVRTFENMSLQTQLRVDQTKAYYLAQAGVMRAIWKWYTNNDVATTNEIARRWSPINTTVIGNNLFKAGSDSAGAYLQSNFAYIVPGIAFVKNVVTGTNTVNTTSTIVVTIPAGVTVPVGDLVVIYFAMDGGGGAWVGGAGPSGAIDSVGNAYTRVNVVVGPGADSNVSVKTVIWYSVLTTALANPNTITIDWTNNTADEAITVAHFSGVDTLDVNSIKTGTLVAGTQTDVSNPVMTNFANELIVGALGIEGPSTETFTAGTDFFTTPPTRVGTIGGAAADITINPEYRYVYATGNVNAAGANSVARDYAGMVAGFYAPNRWFTSGANRRLRQWQIYNTHNASNITLDKVKISWSPAGAELLNDFVLNGVSKWPGGTFASGSTIDLTDTALASGAAWQGANTYIQWNGAVNGGGDVTVTCQFIFSGDTATSDAKTGEVTMWNGAQANGAGMPSDRVFTVTATGQVNQTTGRYFKVLKSVKATVSGAPATAAAPAVPVMEITDWDEEDMNIP